MITNTINYEPINNINRYKSRPKFNKKSVENELEYILKVIDNNISEFTYKFPAPASTNNVYLPTENKFWTSSFWTGMLWLAYEITGDAKYRDVAQIHIKSFEERLKREICVDNHDLGFLYTLSCVSAYKLTGNENAKEIAIEAANRLTRRYHKKAGIIQAWGALDDPKQKGRMIIDCLMNLPLLYWASEVTGESKYFDIAYSHVQQSLNYLIREDASSFHTYYMDVDTGKPIKGATHQGYSDSSSWARGQAWAIYGSMLSYKYTRDNKIFDIAKKVTNYFLNRLPDDEIAYWDLIFTEGDQERDSSASAIAACGILEMVKCMPPLDEKKEIYENSSLKIISSLNKDYTAKSITESNGILIHGVYGKPVGNGIDECCIWGDYFYMEALVRLTRNWKTYW